MKNFRGQNNNPMIAYVFHSFNSIFNVTKAQYGNEIARPYPCNMIKSTKIYKKSCKFMKYFINFV